MMIHESNIASLDKKDESFRSDDESFRRTESSSKKTASMKKSESMNKGDLSPIKRNGSMRGVGTMRRDSSIGRVKPIPEGESTEQDSGLLQSKEKDVVRFASYMGPVDFSI